MEMSLGLCVTILLIVSLLWMDLLSQESDVKC